MTSLGVIFRPQRAPEELRAVAKAADESGIDELWLWEDCFDEGAVASAAAALAWTQRLHVGIGIMPVPLRNPALAAMEIASLARMFGDRVHIGVGHGVLDWMARVGVRAASPMTLLREYVTALQALLAGDTVTTEGDYVRLREVKLGWAPHPKPALHVGARPDDQPRRCQAPDRPRPIARASACAGRRVASPGPALRTAGPTPTPAPGATPRR